MRVKSFNDVKVGMYLIVTIPTEDKYEYPWICRGKVDGVFKTVIEYNNAAYFITGEDVTRGLVEAFTIEERPELFL